MGVLIADGDSIAYWQTVDRDSFFGPFVIRNPAAWTQGSAHAPTVVTLALPAPTED